MASPFDDILQDADDVLFGIFGEKDTPMYYPRDSASGVPARVVLHRNVQVVVEGAFMAVELAADIRKVDVVNPEHGAVLMIDCERYVLDQPVYSDAQINRYTLIKQA